MEHLNFVQVYQQYNRNNNLLTAIKDKDRKNKVHIVPNPIGYKKDNDIRYMLFLKLFIAHRDLIQLKGDFDTYENYFY